MPGPDGVYRIAQISDLHCGGPYFEVSLLARAIGEINALHRKGSVAIVAVDSSEPDLDHGQIGRGRYRWIEEQFGQEPADLKIFVLHHHLLPVPGTGRERNVVYDAGGAIECLQRAGGRLAF